MNAKHGLMPCPKDFSRRVPQVPLLYLGFRFFPKSRNVFLLSLYLISIF